MTREHYVANQAPDWRAAKPGHKAQARRLPKEARKALRDYRRKVIPMADEPRAWDYPLTPTVMVVLAFAVAFVAVLAFAGWLA